MLAIHGSGNGTASDIPWFGISPGGWGNARDVHMLKILASLYDIRKELPADFQNSYFGRVNKWG